MTARAMMTADDEDRLVCPYCGKVNRRGAKPLINVDDRLPIASCAVCGGEGLVSEFMPWIWAEGKARS